MLCVAQHSASLAYMNLFVASMITLLLADNLLLYLGWEGVGLPGFAPRIALSAPGLFHNCPTDFPVAAARVLTDGLSRPKWSDTCSYGRQVGLPRADELFQLFPGSQQGPAGNWSWGRGREASRK